MPHIPIPQSASQVIKNFRTRQLKGLTNHLRLYGPLPTKSEVAASNSDALTTVAEPSIVLPNPFIARKNPKTGKWRRPKYSLRRQADLVKNAKDTDNLAIIPPGPKLFALELRMRRLQAALPPSESAILAAARANFNKPSIKLVETAKVETEKVESKAKPQGLGSLSTTFETELRIRQDRLAALEQELVQSQTQHELDELAAFEKSESEAGLRERRKREVEYASLETRISKARTEVVKAGHRLERAKEDHEVAKMAQAQERLWINPFWVGNPKKKGRKGEELGIKLYAGKKKMFKGHTWERAKVKRLRRQSILMRDMEARIARYKTFYKKRKPNPLKPSRLSKPPKLPF